MASEQMKHAKTGKVMVKLKRFFMDFHVWLYRRTQGRFGGKIGRYSFLLLTTKGRKSGVERVTPLFYYPYGDLYVVIASNWGGQRHPQWWLNLLADPHARVECGGETVEVVAREAEGEERARLWSEITAQFANFADYQKQVEREIPVVILDSKGAKASS
jgi:deazaflavin-dependent oxidoreductase (nitroreductase family)